MPIDERRHANSNGGQPAPLDTDETLNSRGVPPFGARPLVTQSLAAQIAENLRSAIQNGELVGGDRLPAEDELARGFGVSRPTVREALKELSVQGLAITRRGPKGGTFVADSASVSATDVDYDYDYAAQVGFLLRTAYQRAHAVFHNHAKSSKLTGIQFVSLCALVTKGTQSLSQLGENAAVDPSTIAGIVDRLKARGFVQMEVGKTDRRKRVVAITAAGESAVEAMLAPAHQVTEEIMKPLNPAEQVAFLHLLRKVSDG